VHNLDLDMHIQNSERPVNLSTAQTGGTSMWWCRWIDYSVEELFLGPAYPNSPVGLTKNISKQHSPPWIDLFFTWLAKYLQKDSSPLSSSNSYLAIINYVQTQVLAWCGPEVANWLAANGAAAIMLPKFLHWICAWPFCAM